MNESNQQFCPICNKQVKVIERYPKYLCIECATKTTDKNGRTIVFKNTSAFGHGCKAVYSDNPSEIHDGNSCYVNGIACFAQEARFGGIVIQKV